MSQSLQALILRDGKFHIRRQSIKSLSKALFVKFCDNDDYGFERPCQEDSRFHVEEFVLNMPNDIS